MVAQIESMTDSSKEYDVTVENGTAIDCSCKDHEFRHRTCKHMNAMNAEIARAARFLAVKLEVQGMEETWKANRQIFYSEW